MGDDLRIYFGTARIILERDDPRVAQILALVVKDVQPEGNTLVPVPVTDTQFLAMCAAYFARRR